MVVEQFNVQTSSPAGMDTIAVSLLVVGVVLLVANILLYKRLKNNSSGDQTTGLSAKYGLAFVGMTLILIGGVLCGAMFLSTSSPSVVTIGDGYINVESIYFTHAGSLVGTNSNKNVTSEEIAVAFVGEVGSGDFRLHKEYGINFADTNVGKYTLGNGAPAYMASTNSTTLIIELKNGEYLIVGTSDTQAIADSFAQNVHPLQNP